MEYINGSVISDENSIDAQFKSINLNSASGVINGNPNVSISANELKWSSKDAKDHFRAYADGVFSHFEFTGDDTGGLLLDLKVPSTESPYDMRFAIGNPSGNFVQNKGLLLFQDSTGTLAGQELLIRDSAQVGGSGIALPNTTANYVASTLNYYEEYTETLVLSGLTGSTSLPIKIARIGKIVTLSWDPPAAGTGTGFTITTSAIPVRFRPGNTASIAVPVINNAAAAIGVLNVNTNGVLSFSSGSGVAVAFTNAAAAQIYGCGISYTTF
jgi:hypothetical protein